MHLVDPMEMLIPGVWTLTFDDNYDNPTGIGEYTFKLAGTFSAQVRDLYAGEVTWYGYWQIEDAILVLTAQEVTSSCSSCLGSSIGHNWKIEFEQVGDDAFTATVITNPDEPRRFGIFRRSV